MTNLPSNYSYKKLTLYRKSKHLVLSVYKLTQQFPKVETYSLVMQMRRSAISVLANIVEGYIKESSSEYARFLTISIGSLTELEVYLELSLELNFINRKEYDRISDLVLDIRKLLYSTRKSIRARVKQ